WTIVGSGGGGGDSDDDNVRVVGSGEVLKRVVHGGQIELVSVETTANPLRPVLMLIMLRVAHRRQGRFISPWSADVLCVPADQRSGSPHAARPVSCRPVPVAGAISVDGPSATEP